MTRESYQTLSPVRRTFVFLGSRCTQPLTPRNAHALRYEFSKWRTGQRGKLKNTKRFCNEFSTYTLVRKANPRKKDTKLYDIEIDMILNRYRGPVQLPSALIISFLDSFLKTEYFLSEDFWYAAIDYYTSYTWLLKHFVYDCWKDRLMVLRLRLDIALK